MAAELTAAFLESKPWVTFGSLQARLTHPGLMAVAAIAAQTGISKA